MSLLSNFELAERRKKQLEGLPINPTGVVLEKIVSPTEALINGKLDDDEINRLRAKEVGLSNKILEFRTK